MGKKNTWNIRPLVDRIEIEYMDGPRRKVQHVFAWPAMNTYERLLPLHVLTIVFVPHNFILQKNVKPLM